MTAVSTIARYLLGVMFTVFGANGFLHFIKQPPPASELAGQYMAVMSMSHLFMPIFFFQLLGGLLLLAGIYVPLALTILGAILINILSFHIFVEPASIPPAIFATILWILVFIDVRSSFNGLFMLKPPTNLA